MRKTASFTVLAWATLLLAHSSFAAENKWVFRSNALYVDELIGESEGYGGTAEFGYVFHQGQVAEHIIGFETGAMMGDDEEYIPDLGFFVDSDTTLVPLLFNYTVSSETNNQYGLFYEVGGGIGGFITDLEFSSPFSTVSDSDIVFGGQFFGRVGYELSDHLGLTGGVRLMFTDNVEVSGIDVGDLSTLAFDIGLKYAF